MIGPMDEIFHRSSLFIGMRSLLTGLLTIFVAVSAMAAPPVREPALPTAQPTRFGSILIFSPPTITKKPISQIVTQGSNVTFTVSAQLPTGLKGLKPKLVYQWSIKAPNSTATNIISTATNSTLIILNVQRENQGQYYVSVSYAGSRPASAMATLTVPTTNILSSCMGSNSVNVVWDYNLTSDLAVKQFKVYWGVSSTSLTSNQIVDVPNLSTTISNLLANNVYYIQVTALNTNTVNKESLPSNRITYNFGVGCSGIPFTIDIIMLNNNIPRLTAKLCPKCSVTVYRSKDLTSWTSIGATVADKYGNIIFDDHNAPKNLGFYRITTTP